MLKYSSYKVCNVANKNNIIDGYIHKNIDSNLVQLCKDCHNKVHHGSSFKWIYKHISLCSKSYSKNLMKKKYDDKKEQIKSIYSEISFIIN